MKYYNITVNGVAYSVSVEETPPVQLLLLLLPLLPRLRLLLLPLLRLLLPPVLPVPSVSRLPCPATFWMSRSLPAHP